MWNSGGILPTKIVAIFWIYPVKSSTCKYLNKTVGQRTVRVGKIIRTYIKSAVSILYGWKTQLASVKLGVWTGMFCVGFYVNRGLGGWPLWLIWTKHIYLSHIEPTAMYIKLCLCIKLCLFVVYLISEDYKWCRNYV